MMTRRNKRCNHSSKAATVNVPHPSKIQYDSFGFLQQTENDPSQFVRFFSENNPTATSNNRNVFGSRNIKIQHHDHFQSLVPTTARQRLAPSMIRPMSSRWHFRLLGSRFS